MTVKELYEYLNKRIPAELSCEWDNDGLMCCPSGDIEVKKVLVTLDVSDEMAELAIENRCDVILSHHPLIFKPIKSLSDDNTIPARLIKLVRSGISVMSFHTRLDVLPGGVNDVLSEKLGLYDIEPFGDEGVMMGRVGSVDETTLEEFAKFVKTALGSPAVFYNGQLPVRKVAVLGGGGEGFIAAAKKCGADTFVSGNIGYHIMAEAKENGINLIEAGHYFTEVPVLRCLADMVRHADEKAEIIFGDSNNIKSI